MKALLRHRWVIGVAALLLVLSIGAVSWAATGTTAPTQPTPTAPGDPGDWGRGMGMGPGGGMGPMDFGGGPGRGHGMRGYKGQEDTATAQQRQAEREQRRQAQQQRRDAYMKLVREKMTAEDQAKLDSLLKAQTTQQEELKKAADALRSTNQQIHDLMEKYLDQLSGGSTTTTTGTGTTGF